MQHVFQQVRGLVTPNTFSKRLTKQDYKHLRFVFEEVGGKVYDTALGNTFCADTKAENDLGVTLDCRFVVEEVVKGPSIGRYLTYTETPVHKSRRETDEILTY